MALPLLGTLVAPLLKGLFSLVDQAITDKDLAAQIKAQLQTKMIEQDNRELEAAVQLILAESQGSWMQRNWRPSLMFFIMFLMAFNGVAVPLAAALFGTTIPTLSAWNAIPSQMWTLLTVGLGGYIGGRSIEKVAKAIAPLGQELQAARQQRGGAG